MQDEAPPFRVCGCQYLASAGVLELSDESTVSELLLSRSNVLKTRIVFLEILHPEVQYDRIIGLERKTLGVEGNAPS